MSASRTIFHAARKHLLFFCLSLFSFSCQQKEKSIIQTTIVTDKKDKMLENFKRNMAEISEPVEAEGKYVFLADWALSRQTLITLRQKQYDTGVLVTLINLVYSNTNMGTEKEPHYYIERLNKKATVINKEKAGIIYHLLDSLTHKNILPLFGQEKKADRTGDIIDGGNWLAYYNGTQWYQCTSENLPSINMDSLWQYFTAKLPVESLAEKL